MASRRAVLALAVALLAATAGCAFGGRDLDRTPTTEDRPLLDEPPTARLAVTNHADEPVLVTIANASNGSTVVNESPPAKAFGGYDAHLAPGRTTTSRSA